MSQTTEIQAVNSMLRAIGVAPLNSLSGQLSDDQVTARDLLGEVRVDIQLRGWNFNTEKEVKITPDSVSGLVTLDQNDIQIDSSHGWDTELDVVQRGTKLYDRKNHTYTFGKTLTCDVVRALAWEELPEVARQYIKVRAGRILVDSLEGGQAQHYYSAQDEIQALAALRAHDAQNQDLTMLDNISSYRTLNRVRPYR